ncbi:MAG: roadblock/LC7 domain-containing protein [Methanosarcinales archaeon]
MVKRILNEFTKINGVTGAMISGFDGWPIESVLRSDINDEYLAGTAATLYGISSTTSKEFFGDELDQTLIESDKGKILIAPIKELIFVVVMDRTANLGKLRYKLRQEKERIAAAI